MVIGMKVAKIRKKEKTTEAEQQESYSIKSMIKILIILLAIFGIFYLVTTILVKDRGVNDSDNLTSVIDSSKITLSQLLNRSEEEYYVIATKSSLYESSYIETNYIEFYNNYINQYKQNEDSLPFYYVDLDSALNKNYFGDELNITDEISKLKLNDEVLFKINNGKIQKTYIGKEDILDKLSRL